jgi:RNA polymerase sigma-70 factor (ECF subfamily)
LYTTVDNATAKLNYEKAYALAKTQTEQQGIRNKIDKLD